MSRSFFVTGTDTDVGKTFATCVLLQLAGDQGLSTAAVKPVAAGVSDYPQGACNEDVVLLQQACSVKLSKQQINAVSFSEPIAPHIAANNEGIQLRASELVKHTRQMIARNYDLTLIEGAGGWRVPLNDSEYFSDIARQLTLPVILVVGMRLGCINHALLSAQAIQADGLALAGWIANQVDPHMLNYAENIAALKERMPCRMLCEIPWSSCPEKGADALKTASFDIHQLLRK